MVSSAAAERDALAQQQVTQLTARLKKANDQLLQASCGVDRSEQSSTCWMLLKTYQFAAVAASDVPDQGAAKLCQPRTKFLHGR